MALPDGRALAFKIDDGATRALGPVLARALRLLGVDAAGAWPGSATRRCWAAAAGGRDPRGVLRPLSPPGARAAR